MLTKEVADLLDSFGYDEATADDALRFLSQLMAVNKSELYEMYAPLPQCARGLCWADLMFWLICNKTYGELVHPYREWFGLDEF